MIQFKSQRQQDDFYKLSTENLRLARLVMALSEFVDLEFGKETHITDVFRTKEEFDALYAATPVDKRPASSPHCRWEAVDLRSSIYTPREIERMVEFLNKFTYLGGQKPVCLYHTITGNAMHFHIQYK